MKPRRLHRKSLVLSYRNRAGSVASSSYEIHDWLKRAKPEDFSPPKSIHLYSPKKSKPILAFKNAYSKPKLKSDSCRNSLEIIGQTVCKSCSYAYSIPFLFSNDTLTYRPSLKEFSHDGNARKSGRMRSVGASRMFS